MTAFWILIKRKVLVFVMTRIAKFLAKRGLRIAHEEWVNLLTHHLETVSEVRRMVNMSGEIATLRVKHPKVYKRIDRLVEAMQWTTKEALLALHPPTSQEEEGTEDK